jgi:hypothetical protein
VDEVIKPGNLRKAMQAKELERAQRILDAEKRRAEERHQLHDAFMQRQIRPDVRVRLGDALSRAGERGETDEIVLVLFLNLNDLDPHSS